VPKPKVKVGINNRYALKRQIAIASISNLSTIVRHYHQGFPHLFRRHISVEQMCYNRLADGKAWAAVYLAN